MSQEWARLVRRRVMLSAVGVCTLLAVAFVVLWLTSYFRLYSFKRYSAANRQFLYIALTRGGVQLARSDGWDASALGEGFETIAWVPANEWQILTGWGTRVYYSHLGFRWAAGDLAYRTAGAVPMPFFSVRVPLYAPTALCLLPLALRARLAFRNQKIRSRRRCHQCERCGYDLRASPGSCPECGLPAPVASRPTSP